jgi:hypothetical protein
VTLIVNITYSGCLKISTSHIGDPDGAWRLQTAHRQRKYREWPCGSHRSGPIGQQCGSPRQRHTFSCQHQQRDNEILPCNSLLDHRNAAEVEGIITSLPERYSYTKLRNELVQRLCPSRELRIRQLLTFEELGDRKTSQFLRHLRDLEPDVPEDILRNNWSSRLPHNIEATLASQQECSLDAAARSAHRIF